MILSPGQCYAIDTVVLIYLLERHPDYHSTANKIFRDIEGGTNSGVISTLVLTELLVPAYRAHDQPRAKQIVRLLSTFPHLRVLSINSEIAQLGAELRAKYAMRTPDAIHAATGLYAQADGIITNDKGFKKLKIDHFKVILLDP